MAHIQTENLAVKYRPKVLEDLVGQAHLVSEIRGMLKRQRMPAAFMLTGPTGLGKTTTARILSRYINCSEPDPETFAPCGKCANCRMEEHPDVIEVNAADTRGIDDVRSLIRQARNMPTMGDKRIVVVDECQQLLSQSQQCLLKALEEPAANTMWILSSMSPEKLLPALAGRCYQLVLKHISPEDMTKRLYRIARKEGLDFKKIEDGSKVLKSICDLSNGHMRNAVELLDKVLSAALESEDVSTQDLMAIFLNTPEAAHEEIAAKSAVALMTGNLKALLQALNGVDNYRSVLMKLRWLLDYLLQNAIGAAKFTPMSARIFAKLAKSAEAHVSLTEVVTLQALLIDIEFKLNSISIDERILFTSVLGNYVASKKKS